MNDIEKLQKRIIKLQEEIADIGLMRPGSLIQQRRFKDGAAYGSYWHLSYTFRGKSHSEYVPETSLPQIQEEIENYQKFKMLFDKLIEFSVELSRLKIKESELKRKMGAEVDGE